MFGHVINMADVEQVVSDDIILETEGLTKEFAGFVAVNGVNLRVARGTIHALIGPNGAGKTTCFNLLTKFLRPTPRPHRLQGARHHRAGARRRGAARAGALVPDLRGVPAPDRARERAHRAAAQARRLVRFLALEARARRLQRARAGADRRRRACRLRARRRRSSCPTAASARSRSRPRSRSIPKCCCSTSRWRAWGTRTSSASAR